MQKIINGKLYDTDTAKLLYVNDIHDEWWSYQMNEYLYKKNNGEYYLYREMVGDIDAIDVYNYVINHKFEPLTVEKAKKWMEHWATAEEYIKEFGKPEE